MENGHIEPEPVQNGHIEQEPVQNGHTEKEPMLCLSMCAYRKEGMDEEEYRKYMTENHAPLVRGLMVKYGIDKYSMVSEMTLLRECRRSQHANIGLLIVVSNSLAMHCPR